MPAAIPLINRIVFDEKTGCWNWKGSRNNRGYGEACYLGKPILAHRLSAHLWLQMPLDDKRCVLHRCDNPSCFNPKHLFIGTQLDNLLDCISKGRHGMLKKTHCVHGHPFDSKNTRIHKGYRICLACKRADWIKRKMAQ